MWTAENVDSAVQDRIALLLLWLLLYYDNQSNVVSLDYCTVHCRNAEEQPTIFAWMGIIQPAVETNKMSVVTMGQLTTKGYVVPGCVDGKSGEATSWVDVVRKKRPDGSDCSSYLVGTQSVDVLTLFTKQKM
jgi:hypothetical protein